MRILVTGGAGYIGTSLVPLLLERGYEVCVFDSLTSGAAEVCASLTSGLGPLVPLFRNPRFSLQRADVRDRRALASAVEASDAVVHLAAVVGHPACEQWPDEAQTVNVEGTRLLAELLGPERPVIFASTASCYGAVEQAVCTEQTPLRPLSLYGRTKAEAEAIVAERCRAVIYRLATCYGLSPRMRLNLLVNDFVYRALHERRLRVYEGHYRRSLLHVSDAARALVLGLERAQEMAGRVFNVGDERQNVTKLELCRMVARVVPGVEIESGEGRDADQRDYRLSCRRIAAQGFRPSVTLEEGIRELCRALRWVDRGQL